MNLKDIATQKLLKIANELPDFHTLTPQDLQHKTSIPSDIWYEFINTNEDIRQFIHRRTNEDIEFAHRRALAALSKEASRGNVQAIKELNQISGILNQNNNKQYVTHYIPRPQDQEEEKDGNENMPEV
jgi:hypothetical protein